MIKGFLETFFVAFGLALLVAGQALALPGSGHEMDSAMTMDGPFSHAMDHQEAAKHMNDCQGKTCQGCDMANCPAPCSAAASTETMGAFFANFDAATGAASLPVLVGLERHNLPLPPP